MATSQSPTLRRLSCPRRVPMSRKQPCSLTSIRRGLQVYAPGAKFDGADFTNGIIDRAFFRGSSFRGTLFNNAVLSGSTFEEADLQDADFTDACVQRVRHDACAICMCCCRQFEATHLIFLCRPQTLGSLTFASSARTRRSKARIPRRACQRVSRRDARSNRHGHSSAPAIA